MTEQKSNVLMGKYEVGKMLGQGTFAKVYHARNTKTSESVAIKVIDKDKVMKVGLMDQIKREISVMKMVRHPNIVQLYEVMATKTKIYFVLEHVRGDVRRLLVRILDPNPSTRISMEKIMENPWFRKGLDAKLLKHNFQVKEKDVAPPADLDCLTESKQQEVKKPCNLNAFDIISLSTGLDLSGMFEESEKKRESKFTSTSTASTIISKIEDIAKSLRLKLTKKDGGLLKMEGSKFGRKGVMGIDAEIFEVTPNFHLVELKKTNGDTLEYQKVLNQEMRPALKDIVWAWQAMNFGAKGSNDLDVRKYSESYFGLCPDDSSSPNSPPVAGGGRLTQTAGDAEPSAASPVPDQESIRLDRGSDAHGLRRRQRRGTLRMTDTVQCRRRYSPAQLCPVFLCSVRRRTLLHEGSYGEGTTHCLVFHCCKIEKWMPMTSVTKAWGTAAWMLPMGCILGV
ncbi:hypothetical protein PR202_ga28796 [Eleusine coracana subsp. coracana]|uniref:non-specific serine/threonine protein kinase n=1 Tax=Eleusine coracana subsp. coracana TaxID=191504 RepID=A0AAV5DJS0_ELECO|nr:hypothetical protein PR202_ga28796 [Eleusine coracana subsp. coracana]